jgi:hypothetical protein
MNRRNYFKSILALTGLGIGSFSIIKWLERVEPQEAITFHDWNNKSLLISELADIIIPPTDTPGAKQAGVENYIISVMSKCCDQEQQRAFYSGLIDVDDFARSKFGKTFLECDSSSRHIIVEHFSSSLIESSTLLLKIKNKFLGKSFFIKLRELTVEGYCTSYLGATQALSYDRVPGVYNSCMSLSLQQKSWATK